MGSSARKVRFNFSYSGSSSLVLSRTRSKNLVRSSKLLDFGSTPIEAAFPLPQTLFLTSRVGFVDSSNILPGVQLFEIGSSSLAISIGCSMSFLGVVPHFLSFIGKYEVNSTVGGEYIITPKLSPI
jgi:hypothetical protein